MSLENSGYFSFDLVISQSLPHYDLPLVLPSGFNMEMNIGINFFGLGKNFDMYYTDFSQGHMT